MRREQEVGEGGTTYKTPLGVCPLPQQSSSTAEKMPTKPPQRPQAPCSLGWLLTPSAAPLETPCRDQRIRHSQGPTDPHSIPTQQEGDPKDRGVMAQPRGRGR